MFYNQEVKYQFFKTFCDGFLSVYLCSYVQNRHVQKYGNLYKKVLLKFLTKSKKVYNEHFNYFIFTFLFSL